MIKSIKTPYPHICAFEFTGEITKEQFDQVIIPEVKAKVNQYDELNLLYLINTELKNFTAGAWLKDAMIGLNHLTKFKRTAIVTENESLQTFTETFSKVMPGEFKGYNKNEYHTAEEWVAKE